jgi:broad specificity phosphatase PhoE
MIDFRSLDGRVNLYFLRHGESEGNSAGVIQGRTDFPLAARGREQAREAAGWLQGRRIRRVFTSPLKRASETARIVCETLALDPPVELAELTELDTGVFTGLAIPEIKERHPDQWRGFQARSWEGVRGAESIAELAGRAEALWATLAGELRGGLRDALCVTHSGILQWIVKVTFGHRDWMPLVPMGNCAISHFSLDNRLETEDPRYYFEWTRLNHQPFGEGGQDGHLFLKRS